VFFAGMFSLRFYYFKYQRIVDERLKQPMFANTAKSLPLRAKCVPAKADREPDRQ
jgi:hypothetical protein